AKAHGLELLRHPVEVLRGAQEQVPVVGEHIGELRADAPPGRVVEVDQYVAAQNHVEDAEAGERLDKIDPAELDQLTNLALQHPGLSALVKMAVDLDR